MIVLIVELAECPGDDTVATVALLALTVNHRSGHIGNFQQHCTNQVACLQQVHVDVLMVGYLAALFRLFLLGTLVIESTRADSLRQKFSYTARHDITQTLMGIKDTPQSKCAHSNIDHHSVEHNHGGNVVRVVDILLDV